MLPVECFQKKLTELEERSDLLYKKLNRCRRQEAEINSELGALHGGFRGYGLIERARKDLADAALRHGDQEKPRVVWKPPQSEHSYYVNHQFIVSRVTKKTLFIREVGRKSEHKFRLDGTAYSGYLDDKIDVEATLGKSLTQCQQ